MAKKKSGFIGGLLLGSMVGAVTGVFATIFMNTKEGKKLRKDLEAKYNELSKDLSVKVSKIKDLSKESYQKAVNEVVRVSKTVKNLSKEDIAAIKEVLLEEWDTVYSKIKARVTEKTKSKTSKTSSRAKSKKSTRKVKAKASTK